MSLRCGVVGLVGRPNVGKSTLLNRLMGAPMSIVSRKPQTTRYLVRGIDTRGDVQAIYVDTPGLQHGDLGARTLNRQMNRAAASALNDVHLALFVIEHHDWRAGDEWVWRRLRDSAPTTLVVVNKIDSLPRKSQLLPLLQTLANRVAPCELVPVSARSGDNIEHLRDCVHARLPAAPHVFDPALRTDSHDRFIAAELVREQIVRQLGDELPYASAVQVQRFAVSLKPKQLLRIDADALVERDSQKAIVIGRGGARLRAIGSAARVCLERRFGMQVMLALRVVVVPDWSRDDRILARLQRQ